MAQADVHVDPGAPADAMVGARDARRNATTAAGAGLSLAWVILDLAPEAILVIDEVGRIVLANRAAETVFGYDGDALVRMEIDSLVPGGGREAHRGHGPADPDSAQNRPTGLGLDLWARRADGSEFPVEISFSSVSHAASALAVAIVREVTVHRASERLAHERLLLDAHERIGAELHRRVIGHLFASGMNIQAVLARVDPYVAARLAAVTDELDLAISEIRDTVFERGTPPTRRADSATRAARIP
jgi:PAS domain S-box-containing protein